jgi:hypothetical protein
MNKLLKQFHAELGSASIAKVLIRKQVQDDE